MQSDSPQTVLSEYLAAWVSCDWQAMFEKTQLTWQSNNDAGELKQLVSDMQLLDARIEDEVPISGLKNSLVRDISVTLEYKIPFNKKGPKNQTITRNIVVRLIKETAPFKASDAGTWGVNPISALRGQSGDRRA